MCLCCFSEGYALNLMTLIAHQQGGIGIYNVMLVNYFLDP